MRVFRILENQPNYLVDPLYRLIDLVILMPSVPTNVVVYGNAILNHFASSLLRTILL